MNVQSLATTRTRFGLALALGLWLAAWGALPAHAGDAAQELGTTLQRARSRMMAMQVDQAVSHYQEATKQLEALRAADPGHAKLPDLQRKYDKLSKDLAKKVVQRAGRDVRPMQSALKSALGKGDPGAIAEARTKLAAATAKHRANLEAAGGEAGKQMLAESAALLALEPGGGAAPPQGEAAPPKPHAGPARDANEVFKEIQRAFRDASSLATPELVEAAKGIRALIEELRAVDPGHARLAEFERKVDKLVVDAHAGDVKRARGEIDRRITRIASYLERNNEDERPQLRQQRELLVKALAENRAALEAAGTQGQELIARTEAAIERADAQIGVAVAGDAEVNEWLTKLSAYQGGTAKDITQGINGAALHAKVREWRSEASAVLASYGKAAFPQGKPRPLERAAESLQQALKDADYNLEYAVTSRAKATRDRVDYIAEMFKGDQAWRADRSQPPTRFADELLDEASRQIEELAAYAATHPSLGTLRADHARLLKENAERRDAAKAQTFLRPHAYEGSDAEALLAFARARTPTDHPGASALRVTIFTPEWKEESVVEWTDTTKTALRARTTRTLMFCVALRDGQGVFRDFGYLKQDRKADGAWGPVYGHLAKYRAPMLESNVDKAGP